MSEFALKRCLFLQLITPTSLVFLAASVAALVNLIKDGNNPVPYKSIGNIITFFVALLPAIFCSIGFFSVERRSKPVFLMYIIFSSIMIGLIVAVVVWFSVTGLFSSRGWNSLVFAVLTCSLFVIPFWAWSLSVAHQLMEIVDDHVVYSTLQETVDDSAFSFRNDTFPKMMINVNEQENDM